MIDFGLGIACINLYNLVAGKVASIFSIGKWESCKDSQEECLNMRDIGIKMSPIYGAVDECTNELCANAYLTNSYKAGLTPDQSDGKRETSSDSEESLMFFLGTDCLANVKIGGATKQVPVTCLWDASPLLLDYKLQAMSKIPGQEDFPTTFENHWSFVQKAIEASAEFYGL